MDATAVSAQSWLIDTPNCTLVLLMERTQDDELVLNSCSMQADGVVNRTTFMRRHLVEEVLVPQLAAQVAAMVANCATEKAVLVLSDAMVRIPGALLQQARLVTADPVKGVQKIELRFKKMIGSLDRILAKGPALRCSAERESERVAVQVICDIAMPLINLCQTTALGTSLPVDGLSGWLAGVSRNAESIQFRLELLKRLVSERSPGRSPPMALLPQLVA